MATQLRVPWLLVHTEAAPDKIEYRMEKRQAYLRAREDWKPPDETPADRRLLIRGQDSMEDAASRVVDALLLQVPL